MSLQHDKHHVDNVISIHTFHALEVDVVVQIRQGVWSVAVSFY
jgi:hypothetical protein